MRVWEVAEEAALRERMVTPPGSGRSHSLLTSKGEGATRSEGSRGGALRAPRTKRYLRYLRYRGSRWSVRVRPGESPHAPVAGHPPRASLLGSGMGEGSPTRPLTHASAELALGVRAEWPSIHSRGYGSGSPGSGVPEGRLWHSPSGAVRVVLSLAGLQWAIRLRQPRFAAVAAPSGLGAVVEDNQSRPRPAPGMPSNRLPFARDKCYK